MSLSFLDRNKQVRVIAGLFLVAGIVLFGACASSSAAAGGVADGAGVTEPPAVPEGALVTEDLLVYFEDGPAEIRLDLSAVEAAGFRVPEDLSFIGLIVMDGDTGHVVMNESLQDIHRHDVVWDQQPWSLEGIDSSFLVIGLNLRLTQHWPSFFSFSQHYDVEFDRLAAGAGSRTVILRPLPNLAEGLVVFEARNETGIGRPANLGVFLQHQQSGASFHFHMHPGSHFLVYERNIALLRPGNYTVSIRADKDDWAREGNAIWEGEFAFVPGEEHLIGGDLREYIAPWDRGISLPDLRLNNEREVYSTDFEDPDPRMGEPHVSADGQARFEEGNLVVSGTGILSGGLDIRVPTGSSTMVQLRALLPEDGEFFLNTRVWGGSRLAVIVRPDTPEHGAHLHVFSHDPVGRNLSNYHAPLPELTPNRWYDYSFVDTGDQLLIFIDDTLMAVLSVPAELTEQGELRLEWHKPCRFAELRVSQAESIHLPPELHSGE